MILANRKYKTIKKVFSFVTFLTVNFLFSQTYNNEWINYNQRYFKIPIYKNGLYKIGYQELIQAGLPLNSIQPSNFQLFQRGTEIPIYFEGSTDGIFNTQDYFIFYAEKNTCKEDSNLFYYGNFLANPYHSVINDTAAVFLTWNSSTVNKRYEIIADTNFTNLTPLSHFIKEDVISFNQFYYTGPQNAVGTTDPRYSHGEGLSSDAYLMGQNCEVNFNTLTLLQGIRPISLSVVYSGMSNPTISPDHDIQIEYKNRNGNWNSLNQFSFDGYKTFKNDFLINETDVGTNLSVRIKNLFNPNYETNSTRLGIHYFKISYPSTLNFNNSSEQLFSVQDEINQASSFLNISGFNRNGSNPILIDLSNKKWLISSVQNGTIRALVPNGLSIKKCLLSSYSQLQSVSSIIPVNEV